MIKNVSHNQFGNIMVHESAKAKNIRIQVGVRGVLLTIPLGSKLDKGLHFLDTKSAWIEKALLKLQENKAFTQQTILSLAAQSFVIKGLPSSHSGCIFFLKDGVLQVEYPSHADISTPPYRQVIKDGIEKFVMSEAKRLLIKRLREISTTINLPYHTAKIQRSKSRWGSCSNKKHINLSAYLIFVPQELSDYVIIHELCHTKEMNHSDKFWRLVQQFDNNYLAHRKEMKKYSFIMHLFK